LNLTRKQRALLQKLSQGQSLKQAAFALKITHGTAKALMYRARVRNRGVSGLRLMYLFGQMSCLESSAETIMEVVKAA